MALAAIFLVMLLSSPAVFADETKITWSLGNDYSSYANKAFKVGDKLVFTYDNTHTVDQVSEADYKSCNAKNPMKSESSSPTTITLGAGTTYIICGTPGHCAGGMKLQVTTTGASSGGSAAAPSGPPATPSSDKTPPSPSAASLSGAHLGVGLGLGALLVALLG